MFLKNKSIFQVKDHLHGKDQEENQILEEIPTGLITAYLTYYVEITPPKKEY